MSADCDLVLSKVYICARMKILILSKKFPYPLREGEPIAITYLSRSLVQQGCEVSILVMNTSKHYFDPKELPDSYNHFKEIFAVPVDNHITLTGALRSFISGQSYILDRFKSEAFEEKLIDVLRQGNYDVVQIETPYLSHYVSTIRSNSNAVISMRAHNVEHKIWERVADMSKNPIKKWYLKNQNRQLKKFEIAKLNEYDVMLAITKKDKDSFLDLGFSHLSVAAPVGIDLSEYTAKEKSGETSLAFIGALDWMPNQDGLVWFLEKVWPAIVKEKPLTKFHIAGKNTPDWLRKYANEKVIFHGEVPDAKEFINSHSILIAPLFSGSGIKIKVLEGMALERVVVTTEIGVEGISALNGKEILIGKTADDFISNIMGIIEHKEKISSIGKAARQFIKKEFDNLEIADRVISVCKKAMTKK